MVGHLQQLQHLTSQMIVSVRSLQIKNSFLSFLITLKRDSRLLSARLFYEVKDGHGTTFLHLWPLPLRTSERIYGLDYKLCCD